MIRPTEQARGRWSTMFRFVAGTLGAYALTSLVTVALSLLLARLGMDRVEAVYAATLASFAVFAGVAMSAFHARSAARAWGWLLAFGLPLALAVFLMLPGVPS
ncbi:DUF4407 domain-containing protein [Sandaracinobacter sp. RS1-74]|uniref:DUF4407 domain-containing protein n=1 Tax=Sandaracinobacteroides sayramensis TaxID=2913411 RepID=UPI001ED9DE4A|nr:DUF4407 domain-containing protein [Sandaracinobacteroides sayramensis]MCG2841297.1 DUF4407 domain-containing protein [Sandaracinobacteroides sayramensis]